MRISIRKNDPGYDSRSYKYQPYLDGIEIKNCFTADEELGKVWCYKTDIDGSFVLNKAGDCLEEICYEGKVEIKMNESNE